MAGSSNDGNKTSGNSDKVKMEPTSKSIKKWEEANFQEWPTEPDNPNKNQTVSHIQALRDGGTNEVKNIEPKPGADHHNDHKINGDYSRWKREDWQAKKKK